MIFLFNIKKTTFAEIHSVMRLFTFRVYKDFNSIETNQIYRDIEIESTKTFIDLHKIILKAYSLPNSHVASFFVKGLNVAKAIEVTLLDLVNIEYSDEYLKKMKNVIIESLINRKNEKIFYGNSCIEGHLLDIELVEIGAVLPNLTYPRVIKIQGYILENWIKYTTFNFADCEHDKNNEEIDLDSWENTLYNPDK